MTDSWRVSERVGEFRGQGGDARRPGRRVHRILSAARFPLFTCAASGLQ